MLRNSMFVLSLVVFASAAEILTSYFPSDHRSFYNIRGFDESSEQQPQTFVEFRQAPNPGPKNTASIGWIEYMDRSKPEIVLIPFADGKQPESKPAAQARSKRNIEKEDDFTIGWEFDSYTGQQVKPWNKQHRWYRHKQSAFARPVE